MRGADAEEGRREEVAIAAPRATVATGYGAGDPAAGLEEAKGRPGRSHQGRNLSDGFARLLVPYYFFA
jgi:hypothetical protein